MRVPASARVGYSVRMFGAAAVTRGWLAGLPGEGRGRVGCLARAWGAAGEG
jgi:hypothetical protein